MGFSVHRLKNTLNRVGMGLKTHFLTFSIERFILHSILVKNHDNLSIKPKIYHMQNIAEKVGQFSEGIWQFAWRDPKMKMRSRD
jgi:hypothetical protein